MKTAVLFLFLLVGSFFSFAQTIKIKDKITAEPIKRVSFRGIHSGIIIYTDDRGVVSFQELKGEDSIIVFAEGYKEIIFSYQKLASLSSLLLSENIHEIGEVVISATKFETASEETPQQIEVIKSKELKFMNQQTTADVLQNSGHVLVQKSQAGGGSPIIRGFEANKVLIVVDGVRMNNAIYRGGHLQNILTIDNSMLDKVELLFGPGSVLYGSDALGGVMHFYTIKPQLSDSSKKFISSGNTFLRFGSSNNEKSGHVDVNFGFKKLAFLTSVTYSDFDDLRQGGNRKASNKDFGKDSTYVERVDNIDEIRENENVNIQKGTGYSQYDVMQKILFQQNKSIVHILNFQFSNSSTINRYDRLSEVNGFNPKFSEWYYGPQKRLMGSYSLSLKRKTILYDQAIVVLAYQDIEESRHDRRFQNNIISHRTENVYVYSGNADFLKKIKKHEIRYGLEGMYNIVNSTANKENIVTGLVSAQNTRYPDGGSSMTSLSLYGSHSLNLNSKWIITEGIRFSRIALDAKFIDTNFFKFPFSEVRQINNALTGSVGLVFLPGHDWKVGLLGSTGFRAPNIDDISKVYESVGGTIILPNNNLKPEYSYTGELNLSKFVNKRVKLEANGYYTWLTNAISVGKGNFNGLDSILFDGVMSDVNTSLNNREAYIYGFSGGVIAELNDYLSFKQTLSYTFGRIKTDTLDYPLDHIAPLFGRTSVMFKMKKLKVEFFMLYNGWKKLQEYNIYGEDNFIYATKEGTPAWSTMNMRTSFQFNQYVSLQLAFENILDSNYRVFASGVSAAGRSVSITLRGNF